ncbi:related to carbon-nitrogen family hydrolase [Rhynchosporium secalis]|uniref:Related to carbon-nitrogen family hydrolase n=1 Tax=Rhynchosporium secalis TaxID=38038 RepID=A0A1E1M8V0_RHYSE|nr:related to carbon-nitrogen family hydrolase [Rhynchosporium secalis]
MPLPRAAISRLQPTAASPQRFDNVACFISSDGTVLGSYVKKNLWGPTEREFLSSGHPTLNQAFDTPLGKVGLLICWDLAFPEAWRELIAGGAKIIIVPTLWTRSGASAQGLKWNPSAPTLFLDSVLTARTYENTCAVLFSNAGGRPGGNYIGLSQVTVPYVGPLCRLGSAAEGMAVAELDMQILEDAEQNYAIRADLERGGPLEGSSSIRLPSSCGSSIVVALALRIACSYHSTQSQIRPHQRQDVHLKSVQDDQGQSI